MANPNFDPLTSSNTIWFGEQEDVCLTDVVDGKAEADHEHTEYAEVGHTHTEYAASDHSHAGYALANHEHTGYAANDHTHSGYANADHTHSASDVGASPASHTHTPESIGAAATTHTHDYASPTHTHDQSDITGLIASLAAKAEATHDHTLSQIVGLVAALAAKADLVDGKVPTSQLPSYVSDVAEYANLSAFPTTGESSKIYVALNTNKTYRWSGTAYVEIAGGVAIGETSSTAYRGDRGKTAYEHSQNGDVHVTASQKTAWDNKAAGNHTHTPAGIGAATSNHTHSYNDLSDLPTIPAAYTHPSTHPASMITGLSTVATSGKYIDLSGKPTIPTSLPANGGNADTVDGKHADDFASASHTHNYAASNHKHTEHSGDITIVKVSGPGINLSATGLNVKTRIHKNASTTADYGTIISDYDVNGKRDYLTIRRSATSAGNKILLNVEDASGGTTKSYQLYGEHNKPGVLWSGNLYMNASHTVTPSKPLSACRSGWILLWSDYDADSGTTNDGDFVTTTIPRVTPTGGTWGGKSFYCEIPRYIGSNTEDITTESRIIKMIYIYDDKIVGHAANNKSVRTDVVLRAVYEF
jgi:hypothetical protein